ncbi:MAG TPA: ribokinase [Clostridia bacterium]|nr:ribokinase [Clostridia bacterium]
MKILCIGSFNQDMVYSVDHIAAAGETVLSSALDRYWGGKGLNQAVATARSFDEVYIAGMVNRQEMNIRSFLKSNNLHDEFLAFSDKPTGHAIISVDKRGMNSITVYGGANQALTEDYISDVLSHFEPGDIVLLQNETNALEYIINTAHMSGLRIALNPSPFSKELLQLPLMYVDFFLLNEIEGYQITGQTEPQKILDAMYGKFPKASIVLTLGKKGALYSVNGQIYSHGVYDVQVVDTTAAGDTFTGYFLAGLAKGLSPEALLELASIASSIAVSQAGATTSIPYLKQVLEFKEQLSK